MKPKRNVHPRLIIADTCLAERVARICLWCSEVYAHYSRSKRRRRELKSARTVARREEVAPTSILLIKVITLCTESANLILIDVKLGGGGGGGGAVRRIRGGEGVVLEREWAAKGG